MKDKRVLSFPKDGDFYESAAYAKMDEGDLTGALSLFRYLLSLKPNNAMIHVQMADVYTAMELYDEAIACLYLAEGGRSVAARKEARTRLVENLMYSERMEGANYYLTHMDAEKDPPQYSEDFMAFMEGQANRFNPYRTVYPYELADYSHILENARHLASLNFRSEADKNLSSIPFGAKEYPTALAKRSLLRTQGDEESLWYETEQAEAFAREALSYEKDNVTYLYALYRALCVNGKEEFSEVRSRLKLATPKDEEELQYLMDVFCAKEGGDEFLLSVTERFLDLHPYDVPFLTLHAVCAYNVGNTQVSEESLATLRVLSPWHPLADALQKRINEDRRAEEKGKPRRKEAFPHVYYLTQNIAKEYYEGRWREFTKMGKEERARFVASKAFLPTVAWCFFPVEGYETAKWKTVSLLAELKTKEASAFLSSVLMHPAVPIEVKGYAVHRILEEGVRLNTGIVVQYVYRKLKLHPLETEAANLPALKSAYARAVSLLCVVEDGEKLCDKLASAADTLYYGMQMKGKLKRLTEFSEDALAAVLFSRGEFMPGVGAKELARMFNTDADEIREIWEECCETD